MASSRKIIHSRKPQFCQQQEDSSQDTNYDENDSCESEDDFTPDQENRGKRLETLTRHKNGDAIQRLPTRRPNPKVFNRNALLARENRKKKKEMLETLERSVSDLEADNRKLRKVMKLKDTTIHKLQSERAYLKSIIANRTEILSVLKSVQTTKLPFTSSALNYVTSQSTAVPSQQQHSYQTNKSYTSSCSPPSSIDDDEIENGTVLSGGDPFMTDLTDFSFNFTDYKMSGDWDHLLSNPFSDTLITDIPKLDDDDVMLSTAEVTSEHNYFDNNNLPANKIGSGVCVHISSGRISLEFCATCHLNSQNAWAEEI